MHGDTMDRLGIFLEGVWLGEHLANAKVLRLVSASESESQPKLVARA